MSYIFDAFFSTLFGYLCWMTVSGGKRSLLAASLVLAVAGGVRQTTLLFLFPLWTYTLMKVPTKYRLYAVGVLVLSFLSWYLPMISLAGGYTRYHEASQEHWAYVIEPVINAGPEKFLLFSKTVLLFTLYGLGFSAAFFYIYFRVHRLKSLRKDLFSTKGTFFALWVLPSLLFYIFIFVHSANLGYTMVYLPAFFILAANALKKTAESEANASLPRWILQTSLIIALFFNGYVFLFNNTPFSYRFLKKQHEYVNALVKEVRAKFSPENTIIAGEQYLFLGPRHFMYYLPEYRVYIMDESTDVRGKRRRVLWGWNHITYLSDTVDLPSTVRYFVSPLESKENFFREGKVLVEVVDKTMRKNLPLFFYYDIRLAPLLYPYMEFVWGENREVEEPFRR